MSAKLPLNVTDLKPRITVIGVGGAGCNAVNNMIDANLDGVEFVVANTDAQALVASQAGHKLQLGARLTEGLGAGSRPEIGEAAAEETLDDIREVVRGSHMVFIAAGMGGGTGTGAAAVIARAAREQNILTVAVVTKPFLFEGARRMRIAEAGIAELRKHVDTLIVIPNQNLFRIASERTTFAEAFVLADQVLYSGVACIVDLIVKEGLINLDFADVRTVMSGMGSAMMGTGEASGEGRAARAAEEAITNPLLDDMTLAGARGLLLSISGGSDLTLYEVDEAAMRVRQEVDPEANIIVGATFDPTLGDRVRVSIVASGLAGALQQPQPAQQTSVPAYPPIGAPAPPATATAPPQVPSGATLPPLGASERDLIADALQSPHFNELARGPAAPPRQPPPVPPMASWHAADDVEITDLKPGTFAPQGYAPPQGYGGQARAEPVPPEDFSPAPPAEVRRPPRRMPEIEDFPVVGQREYNAKTQRLPDEARPYPSQPPREHHEPRRRGFLDRLTGRAKREGDSLDERRDPHIAASSQGPQPTGSYGVDASAHAAHHGHRDDHAQRSEKPEIPAFLNRSRR